MTITRKTSRKYRIPRNPYPQRPFLYPSPSHPFLKLDPTEEPPKGGLKRVSKKYDSKKSKSK